MRSIIEEPRSKPSPGRSATEIILYLFRFFGYPRSTVYDVVTLEQSNRKFQYAEEESLERTHREDPRSRWKDSSADFGWSRAIVAKISIDCWCSEPIMRQIAEEDLRMQYKSYTLKIRDALWGCSGQSELLASASILASQ